MSKPNCILPVKRTGNQKNPKLIILLSNPGGNPDWPKRLPEYAMDADGEYHDADMDLSVCRDYNEWFDDIITIAARYGIKPSQILILEYYPYHTVRSADFIQNPNKWNSYARDALTENVAILRTHIVHDVQVLERMKFKANRTVAKKNLAERICPEPLYH